MKRRDDRGVTLAEVIIVFGLSTMILLLLFSLLRLSLGFSRYGKSFDMYLNTSLARVSDITSILASAGSGYRSEVGIVLFGSGDNQPFDYLWVSDGFISKDIVSLSPDSYPVYGVISNVTINGNQVNIRLEEPFPTSTDTHNRIGVNFFTVESPITSDTITVILDARLGLAPTCLVDPNLRNCTGNTCPSIADCIENVAPVPCPASIGVIPTNNCLIIESRRTLLISSLGYFSHGRGAIIYRDNGGITFIFAGIVIDSNTSANTITLQIDNQLPNISDNIRASNIQPGDRIIPAHLFYPQITDTSHQIANLLLDGRTLMENLEAFKVGFEWDTDGDGESDLRVFSGTYPPAPDTFLPISKIDLFFGVRSDFDNTYRYPNPSYRIGYNDAFYTRFIDSSGLKCRHFTLRLSSFTQAIVSTFSSQ